jgi:hypothetical protein
MTFYCLKFETAPTWRARSPYLYPPGTGSPIYTPRYWDPFSSPPMTRRATAETFKPTPTRACPEYSMSVLCYDRWRVGQSVLVSSIHLGPKTRFLLLSDSCGFLIWGALPDEMTGLSFTVAARPRQQPYLLPMISSGHFAS